MFAFFKSRTKSKIEMASKIAAEELLGDVFPYDDVKDHASRLVLPKRQTAEMLATQTALWFFRNPGDKFPDLFQAQIIARLSALEWHQEGKIPSTLLFAFEQSLYKMYHPNNRSE
ncbi:hypothetical protein [Oceanomicrobium pacificus]|uniref:Uncharacterized protein n=1 Tax=Oceanomicrobium pacificus TaxID=2692916 RepID=A0A6B0TT21_9RHOB|nr:hypothetical protein [Oceanomicrobium pacificus]MXU65919.1 hypothetical protein [Oceanomicrobium pacificus]